MKKFSRYTCVTMPWRPIPVAVGRCGLHCSRHFQEFVLFRKRQVHLILAWGTRKKWCILNVCFISMMLFTQKTPMSSSLLTHLPSVTNSKHESLWFLFRDVYFPLIFNTVGCGNKLCFLFASLKHHIYFVSMHRNRNGIAEYFQVIFRLNMWFY